MARWVLVTCSAGACDDWLAADARTLTSCWAGLRGGTFGDLGAAQRACEDAEALGASQPCVAVLYDGGTRRYVLQGGGGSAAARSLRGVVGAL